MIFSKKSLQKLVEEGFPDHKKCSNGVKDFGNGDEELHNCMKNLNIQELGTLDEENRGRIFQADVGISLFPTHQSDDGKWNLNKLSQGDTCCSIKPISFHGLKENKLYLYEYLINIVHSFGKSTKI